MELSTFLLSISLIVVYFLIKPFFQPKNLPPGPINFPIIGSLHRLGAHPNQSLAKLAKIHGELMTLRLGSLTTVVASSAKAAREILHVYDENFSDRFVTEAVAAQPDPEATLVWAPGDHLWRNRRRVCNKELFNNQKLDELQHLRHKKAQELVSYIRKCAASGNQVIWK